MLPEKPYPSDSRIRLIEIKKPISYGEMLKARRRTLPANGLIYQLFSFEPFSSILDTDLSSGIVDVRPTRNLAMFTQIIGKFEYLHRISVFNHKYLNRDTERLFNTYLRLLFEGGITEYEDDSEYAPSGCVSFMTIHQSKGMEFLIVFVDSLSNSSRKNYNEVLNRVEQK